MPSFINKQTTLDLNGPVISFVQNPQATSVCVGGTVNFVGLATATFPTQTPANPATNTGYISYNWYLNDTALSDGVFEGTTVTGASTTSLTLSGVSSSILFRNSKVFLRADYIPSAYSQPSGSDVNAGTARSTGNAINDPKDSDVAILNIFPNINIIRQPGIAASTINTKQYATLTVRDNSGSSFTIDSSQLSSFSNFIIGREYTITTDREVKAKVYAVGGGGGREVCRAPLTGGTPGGSGGAAQGTFTFLTGKTYKLIVGGGAINSRAGYGGGGSCSSSAGAGGGYTGLFLDKVDQNNSIIIAGGGGGAAGDPAVGGDGGGLNGKNSGNAGRGGYGASQSSGGSGAQGGTSGSSLQGGSGSGDGGGGGGGYFGGGGGGGGCAAAGAGGGGSGYISSLLIENGSFSASGSAGGGATEQNGSFKIEFLETIVKSYADTTAAQGSEVTFTLDASTTDVSQGEVSYQWQLNGVDLNDDPEFTYFPPSPKITITDSLGGSTSVSLSELSSYSNFSTGRIYTLVSDFTIDVKAYAVGAGGGGSTGGKGGASQGTITLLANKEYKLVVGLGGSRNGIGDVSGGGSASNDGGNSGGGFTGIFFNAISQSGEANFPLLIAGGGGGAAENDYRPGGDGGGLNGVSGAGDNGATQTRGGFAYVVGENGTALKGGTTDGAASGYNNGGGAGGGGYWGGGASRGDSNFSPGPFGGGGGSGYIHPTLVKDGSFSSTNSAGGGSPGANGSFKLEWIRTHIVNKTFVSGSKTKSLRISLPNVSTNFVGVKLTHPTACNSPLYSDTVQFDVVASANRAIVRFEGYTPNSTTATLNEFDITNEDYVLDSSIIDSDTICFYASERDVTVEMELYGAKGDNSDYTSPTNEPGGEGGYSKIRFKMMKNDEYILKGIKSKTALYLYRKAQLIACVGQGGKGGHYGAGGRGGGVNVAGESGFGRLSGAGGQVIPSGQMSGNGIFGSSSSATNIYTEDSKASGRDGGRTISCTKGVYWREQGKTACADVGVVKFRLSDGKEVINSASITRGFKDGYGINQTAGTNAGSDGGAGGNGATGGTGGQSGGGGGGSGYSDGSITVVETSLGGHNQRTTKMIIRSFETTIGDFYEDSAGRILILSCATAGKDPRTLTKTTSRVLPGTDTCLDDTRWQNFIELAKTQNYRLAVTLDGNNTSLNNVTDFNLRKMINANRLALQTSLTGWQVFQNRSSEYIILTWDENSDFSAFGADYSGILWGFASSNRGFGYYSLSSNSPFTKDSIGNQTANWWILPPGVPDFP